MSTCRRIGESYITLIERVAMLAIGMAHYEDPQKGSFGSKGPEGLRSRFYFPYRPAAEVCRPLGDRAPIYVDPKVERQTCSVGLFACQWYVQRCLSGNCGSDIIHILRSLDRLRVLPREEVGDFVGYQVADKRSSWDSRSRQRHDFSDHRLRVPLRPIPRDV